MKVRIELDLQYLVPNVGVKVINLPQNSILHACRRRINLYYS